MTLPEEGVSLEGRNSWNAMNSPTTEIAQYIHHLEDREWITRLVSEYGVSQMLECISALVLSGGQDSAHNALTLARDVGIFGFGIVSKELTSSIRNEMPTALFPALRAGLYAKSHAVRSYVVYTIGKLSFDEQAPALREAFEHHKNRDPLLLPRIVNELFWLLPEPEWSYVKRLTSAAHHLIRWSAIGAFAPYSGKPGDDAFVHERQTYARLANDSFDLLREESRYGLAMLARGEVPSSSGYKRRILAVPKLTFETIALRFTNQLKDGADYTIEDLDAFVTALRSAQSRSK